MPDPMRVYLRVDTTDSIHLQIHFGNGSGTGSNPRRESYGPVRSMWLCP